LEPNFRHFKIVLEIVYKTPNLRKPAVSEFVTSKQGINTLQG